MTKEDVTCPFALPALTRSPGQAVENAVHTGSADGAYTYWSKQFSPQHCAAGRCGVFVPCSWRGSNCRASCTYLSYCQPAEASAQALYLKMWLKYTWSVELGLGSHYLLNGLKPFFKKKYHFWPCPWNGFRAPISIEKHQAPPFFVWKLHLGIRSPLSGS